MKLKAFVIVGIILISLVPVYLFNKYLQKVLRPRESAGRFITYLFIGLILIFAYTFLLVFAIKRLFPNA